MNVARREVDGSLNPEEPTAAQIFITTAREKTVFMYGKLIVLVITSFATHPLSTYAFIGGNKTFNLKTYTKELSISDNMMLVKYNLEGNDFEFKFEVVE